MEEKTLKKIYVSQKYVYMPQFDQFSFLNQVFWFFIFFLSFYFYITYFFLPEICFNLKFRKKKIIFDNKKKNQINFEKNNIYFFFNNSYKFFSSYFESFITKKTFMYQQNEFSEVHKTPLLTIFLTNTINNFLNQKFLFLKKILINN